MVNLSKITSLSLTAILPILLAAWLSGNVFSLKIADSITIRPLDAVLVLVWLVALGKANARPFIPLPVYFFLIAGFSLIIGSRQLSQPEFLAAFAYLCRWALYAFSAYALVLIINRAQTRMLLILLPLATAASGLSQYLLLPDVRFLFQLGWDDHYYRAISHLLDPGFTAAVIAVGFLFIVCSGKSHLPVYKIILAVFFFALLLTYSRAGYLSLIVGLTCWGLLARKKLLSAFIIALFLIGIILLPRPSGEGGKLERTASVFARLTSWGQAVSIFQDHPLLGVGFNAYRYARRDRGFLDARNWQSDHAGAGADSSLLFVLATTGLIGLAAFGHWLFHLWKHLGAFRPILAALFIHSFFLNSLFYPFILLLVGLLISLSSPQPTMASSASSTPQP